MEDDLVEKLLFVVLSTMVVVFLLAEIAVADFEGDDGDKSVAKNLLLARLYMEWIWRTISQIGCRTMEDLDGKLLSTMRVLLTMVVVLFLTMVVVLLADGDTPVAVKLGTLSFLFIEVDLMWRISQIGEISPIHGGIICAGGNICRFWLRYFHDFVIDKSLDLLEHWRLVRQTSGELVWFRYSGTRNVGKEGRFLRRDYFQKGNLIMRGSRGILSEAILHKDHEDNCLAFYEELCRKEGCISAKISSMCHFDAKYRNQTGFFIQYLLTYKDRSVEIHDGPAIFFAQESRFVDPDYRDCRKNNQRWFHLEDDEYLTGLRIVRTEKILCGITFVTSKKREFNSGHDGIPYDTMVTNPPNMHIVAFCLTYSANNLTGHWSGSKKCDHIGFYAKSTDFGIRVHLLLLHELVGRGRAEIAPVEDNNENNQVVQRMVLLDDDLFRHVLGFVSDHDE